MYAIRKNVAWILIRNPYWTLRNLGNKSQIENPVKMKYFVNLSLVACWFPARKKIFSREKSEKFLGTTKPRTQKVPRALSLRVKRSGHYVDHWPASSAGVKNEWSYSPTRLYVFMACTGTSLRARMSAPLSNFLQIHRKQSPDSAQVHLPIHLVSE